MSTQQQEAGPYDGWYTWEDGTERMSGGPYPTREAAMAAGADAGLGEDVSGRCRFHVGRCTAQRVRLHEQGGFDAHKWLEAVEEQADVEHGDPEEGGRLEIEASGDALERLEKIFAQAVAQWEEREGIVVWAMRLDHDGADEEVEVQRQGP